ncbi:MAG: GHMP family kinase ATP-binding protein [Promethearchaeota archaeon]
MIFSKTPVRIEIGGGATDVEPYSTDYGGYVINTTIDKFIRVFINLRDDKKINIFTETKNVTYSIEALEEKIRNFRDFDLLDAALFFIKPQVGFNMYIDIEAPKKAGLGASASLCTAILGAFCFLNDENLDIDKIAENAYYIEQEILKNEGGRQDQYAAVYGGFNEMVFLGGNNVKVKKLNLSGSFKNELEQNLILFYTGEPHISGSMVKKQVDFYLKDKEKAKKSLDKLKEIAYYMRDTLLEEDFYSFGKLLTKDWIEKSKFNPLLTTIYMKKLNNLVMKNGGIGGRVCGAGGGGSFIWLVDSKKRDIIKELLKKQRGKLISYKFIERGIKISNI